MSDQKRIRIIIVDDHAVVRSGLTAFLSVCDDLELVAEAGNGSEAISLCAKLRPDVVLMDLALPDTDGATVTYTILENNPRTCVVVLTNYYNKSLVQEALRAGATSYLLKGIAADELASAIRASVQGRRVLAPEVTQTLIEVMTQTPTPSFDLTTRELDVLRLMAAGMSNPQIAGRLMVSPSTVKFHVSSILSKLGVSSRTEAVSQALQQKLIN